MATLSQLQTWLTEAEEARHKLQTGSMIEEIGASDGTRSRYMRADLSKLESYILQLRQEISAQQSQTPPRGPIYPVFHFD